MTDFTFNRSKGRGVECAERVNGNDPATAVFFCELLATSGIESDATLVDKDDFAALVSGATNFATGTGWGRYTIADGAGITITYDDTNDRVDLAIPDKTYTAVANAADDVSKFVTGYGIAAAADAAILPITAHDWVIQPDGSDVTLDVPTAGILRVT